MTLAGPVPRYRIALNAERARVVVCGVFPPENVSVHREIAALATVAVQAKWTAQLAELEHVLLYGDSSIPEPRGIIDP